MKNRLRLLFTAGVALLIFVTPASARIKLVALPERGNTLVRLDNPRATLIEEERVLTLQEGLNKVDFSWKGVNIDVDSIRLTVLTHPEKVTLLNVSYPPNEAALVWDIHSQTAAEVNVRISYLLSYIDRLIAYKEVADKEETRIQLYSFLVLRNFSGEDFEMASVLIDPEHAFRESIRHEETKQVLYFSRPNVPVQKVWTWDAAKEPWDPEKIETNVGIPVHYQIENVKESGLGSFPLSGGKVRVFQDDGHEGAIFLGEDYTRQVPVGEKMKVYIGDSRDIVVTQRKMRDRRINIRQNSKNQTVLYDTDELIKATVENFKDQPAILTMLQHIAGQWDMEKCNREYTRKDAQTLQFVIELPPKGREELVMQYHRRNVR
jgi:hypothetical protein